MIRMPQQTTDKYKKMRIFLVLSKYNYNTTMEYFQSIRRPTPMSRDDLG